MAATSQESALLEGAPMIDSSDLSRPADFTGLWKTYWPNGALQYQGAFLHGVPVGQHVQFWESGCVASLRWHDREGHERGTSITFFADGDKHAEEQRDTEDRRAGTFVKRCYDGNGDVFLLVKYDNFGQVDSWERPSVEPEVEADREIDRIVADAVREIGDITERQGKTSGDNLSLEQMD